MLSFLRPSRLGVNLALQGGGAHGAFTWGVLDALLEDGRIDFDGLSGTSAGAMNAVLLADGLLRGGRDAAREQLARFWAGVAASVPLGMVMPVGREDATLAPAARLMLHWAQFVSPYQFNPLDLNPLRELLLRLVDFDRLRRVDAPRLFVAATRIDTARLHLFRNRDLDVNALLASSCLPNLQQAVEIEGRSYWDGAYAANPAVFPLLSECASRDTLLVLLSPSSFGPTPRTAQDIRQRALELAFNSPFMREMHLIAQARRVAAASPLRVGRLDRRLTRARFHLIEADGLTARVPAETRIIPYLPFLERLRDFGRDQAHTWLSRDAGRLGRESSVDVSAHFG